MPILEYRRAASIVRAVIDLTHDLQVTCVAEGVEGPAVADLLEEYGCDLAQGYYFSPPVAAPMLLDTMATLDPLTAQQKPHSRIFSGLSGTDSTLTALNNARNIFP